MIYMTHNAKVSYSNADGAGDEKMKRDIILSEIAKFIIKHPKRVISHLAEVGVKVKGGRKHLVKAVSDAMHHSPKFAELMASDLAKDNQRSASGDEFSASGDRKKKKAARKEKRRIKKLDKNGKEVVVDEIVDVDENGTIVDSGAVDVGALAGAASTIKNAFGNIFGGKKKKAAAAQAEKDRAQAEKDLLDKTNAVSNTTPDLESHLTRNILIGVGVALVIGGSIWAFVHFKK